MDFYYIFQLKFRINSLPENARKGLIAIRDRIKIKSDRLVYWAMSKNDTEKIYKPRRQRILTEDIQFFVDFLIDYRDCLYDHRAISYHDISLWYFIAIFFVNIYFKMHNIITNLPFKKKSVIENVHSFQKKTLHKLLYMLVCVLLEEKNEFLFQTYPKSIF